MRSLMLTVAMLAGLRMSNFSIANAVTVTDADVNDDGLVNINDLILNSYTVPEF